MCPASVEIFLNEDDDNDDDARRRAINYVTLTLPRRLAETKGKLLSFIEERASRLFAGEITTAG